MSYSTFACGRKFVKENAIFADTLADKYRNSGIDHGWWATKIGLRPRLTSIQVDGQELL